MGFSAKQVSALRRNVDVRFVRTRAINGRELSYLEGWYAIAAANRIFGFDAWSRETLETKCVLARESRGAFLAVYTAKVRITVAADGQSIIREGHGTGESRAESPGEAHDTALKAAETDATKRALITFGKPFGLELYRPVTARQSRRQRPTQVQAQSTLLPPKTTLPPEQAPALTASQPEQPATEQNKLPRFQNAKPHPDDGTPIPRPSTHYGLETYLATREDRGELVRQAAETAISTEAASAEKVAEARLTAPSDPVGGAERQGVPVNRGSRLPNVTRPAQRIDKSVLPLSEPKRLRDKNHLKFVASQPCLICGRQPADPHHLRFAQPRAIGLKVSDEFTVPLCRSHHRNLHHAGNELRWWENFRIEPLPIARKLWEETRAGAKQICNVDESSKADVFA